ncbi:hypothetical protein GCM10027277_10320 [Pseudoduganella ginsengisoli]|uniref:DUF4431 domain-containing protein n=1 Tax=Pseudoduganella ginsengisoli TaxID=1462440 RepID=A0A6L6PWS0_9BURK|nr:DUF4431 domain-containing protein [Pseudoduganella ginsengisoli]MTW01428.1 DUF4431 domain-containing protein [Pseudoduganella ginsengisoli]
MTRFTVSCALLLAGLAFQAQAAPCLRVDDHPVTLHGMVVIQTFYGPPGYGETPKTDRRETQGLLKLDAPVCIGVSDADGVVTETQQSMVTMVPPAKVSLKHYRGKKVTASGSLFQAVTGHHHTDVLIDVEHIDVAKQKGIEGIL